MFFTPLATPPIAEPTSDKPPPTMVLARLAVPLIAEPTNDKPPVTMLAAPLATPPIAEPINDKPPVTMLAAPLATPPIAEPINDKPSPIMLVAPVAGLLSDNAPDKSFGEDFSGFTASPETPAGLLFDNASDKSFDEDFSGFTASPPETPPLIDPPPEPPLPIFGLTLFDIPESRAISPIFIDPRSISETLEMESDKVLIAVFIATIISVTNSILSNAS